MDSLTHIALGAVAGYVVAGNRLGRRSMAYGAVACTIPDLDSFVLMPFEHDDWAGWLNHRGVSHSLFFGPVVGPLLGWLAWRFYRRRAADPAGTPDALWSWIALFVVGIFIHPLLDLFTIYGTRLLAPFSDTRFAISGLGIVDPFYTVPLIVAAIVALIRPDTKTSKTVAWVALWLTTAFLFYGVDQNKRVWSMAKAQLLEEGVTVSDVRVYTTIFQPWLRRIVVDEPVGARVAFATPLQEGAIAWNCFVPSQDLRLTTARQTRPGRLLSWFADDDLWPEIVAQTDGTILVQLWDRRYGVPGPTINGWWGVEAVYAADGRLSSAPRRIDLPRDVTADAVGQLFRASFGAVTPLFPQAASAAAAAEDCRRQRRAP